MSTRASFGEFWEFEYYGYGRCVTMNLYRFCYYDWRRGCNRCKWSNGITTTAVANYIINNYF